jgi:hypothetical protein
MEGVQVRQSVTVIANIWVSLGKKPYADVVATLNLVSEATLQQLLIELPVGWIQQVESITAAKNLVEKQAKKQASEANKKEKEAVAKKGQEKIVQVVKKQSYDGNLDFASFYSRIKQSMVEVRDRGSSLELQMLSQVDSTLSQAVARAREAGGEDCDLAGARTYVQQALVAQKGVNSFAFTQAIAIGKRFCEVFQYHQSQKDSDRFKYKNWSSYTNYLAIIAPGVSSRQERNYRRIYEISQVFPCVQLILDCSVNEFWVHLRHFRDLLERNDDEAFQWRCPVSRDGQDKNMGFVAKIEYAVDFPFADCNVKGHVQNEGDFIEQKDSLLFTWNNEDEMESKAKRLRSSEPDDMDEESNADSEEYDLDEEEYEEDVDILN